MAIELDATFPAERGSAVEPVDRTASMPAATRTRRAAAELAAGSRLAHFRLERALGMGGMGEVWLATDLALDRPVAIKLLPAEVAADANRRERLVREARAQARLNHPHVCHIYFIGEENGLVFFAMEYVAGETLAARLERGPLLPDEAIELARQAAQGLRAAHKAGFTHRDVKPSNLMIDGNGMLKVMDFGLVSASPEPMVDDGAPLTATSVAGTPLYMAPEQGRGEVVDLRADIYALGATLHHMIAGAPPFAGDTAAELLSRHETLARTSLTALGRARREVTLVDGVIAKMMAKRAADRYASYDELIAALDRASAARIRPAGFWVRGTATVIDFFVVALVVAPVTSAAGLEELPFMVGLGAVVYVAMLARFGATPGHALMDLRIVDHESGRHPGWLAAVTRGVIQYGPALVGIGMSNLGIALGVHVLHLAGQALGILGLAYPPLELVRVSWRTLDKRTLWDRVAGTRVQYRAGPVPRST